MLHRSLAAALLTAAVAPALPAREAETDPAIARAVVAGQDALRKLDWKAYAAAAHPDSLKEFREILVPVLQAALKSKADPAPVLAMFDGAKDIKTALGWPPDEFFVRFMTATASAGPMKAIAASLKSTPLGSVREGADRAHAVVRTSRKYGTVEIKRVEVVTLRKYGAAWKLTLGDEARGLAEAVKASLAPGNVGQDKRTVEQDPDD